MFKLTRKFAVAAILSAAAAWVHGPSEVRAQSGPQDASHCPGGTHGSCPSVTQCDMGQSYATFVYAYHYNSVSTDVASGSISGYDLGAYYDCTYPSGAYHSASVVCAGGSDSFSVTDGGDTWNLSWDSECPEVDLQPCADGPDCSLTQSANQSVVDCGPAASAVIAK